MVKEITKYECEICNQIYDEKAKAVKCEEQGVIPLLPIGTIFAMVHDDMVFAVIHQYPKIHGHDHTYSTWACRDTPAGDNCSGKGFCILKSWDKIYPPDKTLPAHKRMLEALKKANITPIDYEE